MILSQDTVEQLISECDTMERSDVSLKDDYEYWAEMRTFLKDGEVVCAQVNAIDDPDDVLFFDEPDDIKDWLENKRLSRATIH